MLKFLDFLTWNIYLVVKKLHYSILRSTNDFEQNFKKHISNNHCMSGIICLRNKKGSWCSLRALQNASPVGSTVPPSCFIADSTEEKVGKFSPGTHIPIVSIEEFHKQKPDVAILFAWNHKKEILEKEKNFSKNGGIWLSHVED